MLKSLLRGVNELEKEFLQAMFQDLRADETTSYMVNVMILKSEIKECIRHLDCWTKPKRVDTPLSVYPGRSSIKYQPRGVALVMGSWNYPVNTLSPFVSAIAAGNAVMIKPSEFAPATSHIMKKLFDKYLD